MIVFQLRFLSCFLEAAIFWVARSKVLKHHYLRSLAMKTINPDPKKFHDLPNIVPADQPIVMLNLLKFREQADYKEQGLECTGREAYKKYSEFAIKRIQEIGGSLLWMGDAKSSVIAPPDEDWDEILLVRYPNAEAFIKMVAHPEYQQFASHRTAALENSRLIASVETHHEN